MKHWILLAGLASAGCAHVALAAGPLQPAILITEPGAAAAEDDYTAGAKAMNEQRWQDSITSFDKVIAAKGAKADAALYWKAYALTKLGRREDSASTCAALRSEYPKSTWNKDCAALGIRTGTVRVVVGKNGRTSTSTSSSSSSSSSSSDNDEDTYAIGPVPPVPPVPPIPAGEGSFTYKRDRRGTGDPDADLKILALNALANQDASRAVPVIRDLLKGNQLEAVKRQALFVLGQNKSPECQNLLREIALGKQNPELQRQAMQMLAITQGKKANDTLAEAYRQSTDPKTKRAAVSAMFISGDAQKLVELARGEKDLEMKRQIVSQLALMNDKVAQDYMLELLR
ncbi:HEAT repeat domain-containing protein [Terriglobus albidus]|uniref:HEAT repeat domain-containing protein n=1 Tax=Terriglobus albidus TaxID=1592106 RepID=UPI0021DF8116|nr:HEAT repeat domain-containing protein [Terriglobus albidus]